MGDRPFRLRLLGTTRVTWHEVQLLSHVTVTPDGETAVSFDWGSFACR